MMIEHNRLTSLSFICMSFTFQLEGRVNKSGLGFQTRRKHTQITAQFLRSIQTRKKNNPFKKKEVGSNEDKSTFALVFLFYCHELLYMYMRFPFFFCLVSPFFCLFGMREQSKDEKEDNDHHHSSKLLKHSPGESR